MKNKMFAIFVLSSTFLISSCDKSNIVSETEVDGISFIREEYHNGDAKYYKNNIITSVNSQMKIIDLETNSIEEIPVLANWIDCYDSDNLIIYGNGSNQIGICKLDNDNNLLSNKVVFKRDNLMIDPTITKFEDEYYLTFTTIEGEVNNSDPQKQNGDYTVELYKTKDPLNDEWEHVTNILSETGNIEDVELHVQKNEMFFFFEKEVLDRGTSNIEVITSTDFGNSWSHRKTIIENNADNEPASFVRMKNGWELYYSSDVEEEGGSYNSASAFVASLDDEYTVFNIEKIVTETQKGILLYDIKKDSESLEILYSRNYMTTSDLVEEIIKNKNP